MEFPLIEIDANSSELNHSRKYRALKTKKKKLWQTDFQEKELQACGIEARPYKRLQRGISPACNTNSNTEVDVGVDYQSQRPIPSGSTDGRRGIYSTVAKDSRSLINKPHGKHQRPTATPGTSHKLLGSESQIKRNKVAIGQLKKVALRGNSIEGKRIICRLQGYYQANYYKDNSQDDYWEDEAQNNFEYATDEENCASNGSKEKNPQDFSIQPPSFLRSKQDYQRWF